MKNKGSITRRKFIRTAIGGAAGVGNIAPWHSTVNYLTGM